MATSQRRKGSYHETKVLEWLQKIGFKAKKQPLSGQLGGEYRGDILLEIGGHELVVEIKYRDVHSRTLTNDVQYFPPKERVY